MVLFLFCSHACTAQYKIGGLGISKPDLTGLHQRHLEHLAAHTAVHTYMCYKTSTCMHLYKYICTYYCTHISNF